MTKQAIHSPLRTTFQNIRKNADKLIKKDLVRAMVELITNSDDSYRHLEKAKRDITGRIDVDLIRARPDSFFEVFDQAEGMDAETMHRVVQLIGKEEGEISDKGSRGFFREGLKFSIIGMGYGSVTSIKKNRLYRSRIDDKGFYNYDPSDEKIASPVFRDQYLRGALDNGTIVRVVISREDIKSLPLFSKLAEGLSRFFSLRDLLSNQNREVFLVERDKKHKEKARIKLQYRYPTGNEICNTTLSVKGFPGAEVDLKIYKTTNPLLTKWEVGNDYRENGLIVRSGGAIHDVTFFRFDNEDYRDLTSHLFGFVTCEYIKQLMEENDDQVINDTRDGINPGHPFIKAMRACVEAELKKIIDQERASRDKESAELESEAIKKLFKSSVSFLNQIAQKELSDVNDGPTRTGQEGIPIPPDGFNFFPEVDYLVIGKKYYIKLIGDLSVVPTGSKVSIDIDNPLANDPEIDFSPKKMVIEDTDVVKNNIWVKRILLTGRKIDAQRTLTATYKDKVAEAVITITKGGGKPREKQGTTGLVREIKYDPEGEPQLRVRFIDGVIRIHTKAPSVSRYLGPIGQGQEKLHSRMLMAELITEAIIGYIARQKGLAGKLLVLDESQAQEAVERERNKLQFQYGHLIHKIYVKDNEIKVDHTPLASSMVNIELSTHS